MRSNGEIYHWLAKNDGDLPLAGGGRISEIDHWLAVGERSDAIGPRCWSSPLSVDHTGQGHGGGRLGLGRGGLEKGPGMAVRTLLLVAQLVVVGAEPSATVAAGIRLLA